MLFSSNHNDNIRNLRRQLVNLINVLTKNLIKNDKKLLKVKKILVSRKLYNKVSIQKRLKIYKHLYNQRFSSFLLSGKIQYI